jgi:hypothetical protein
MSIKNHPLGSLLRLQQITTEPVFYAWNNMELKKAPLPFKEKKVVRCGGILQGIEFNPNESTIWIMRLTVTDAFVRSAQ